MAYTCELTVYDPKPFEAEIFLHLQDHDIRTVTLTVRGVGSEPEGKPNAPQPST